MFPDATMQEQLDELTMRDEFWSEDLSTKLRRKKNEVHLKILTKAAEILGIP
jgi:hypothetical protein